MRKPLFFAALLAGFASAPPGAAQTPASTWTIPGTVNAGGLNNTRFVSDLAVTNPGSVPVQATISFIPAGRTTPQQVTLGAGQTVAYRNVLDSLWGAQGAGATQVASDSPLLIRARTYNTAASGTFGVALPVFADDRLLSAGDMAHSLWISQSADGTAGYRTNVAVIFPDLGGGSATVTVYDAEGNEVGSQDFSLNAPGFQQFGVGSFAGAVSIARARVRVLRGRAAGYSVVVDNITGDSSLFTFESLPAGRQDVLVNGVARANGRNSTFFRTDGRFYNPGSADATVSVAFHTNQSANPAPLTGTFTVPAGKIVDVVDVLGSLLGLPVGSAGALHFTSNRPVAILCRTSNVDPLGVQPGTFGAQQKPSSLYSFLMSADPGALVTGIRQNAAFRTNIGFAAGGDGAAYSLTLKGASGATVATATGSLGPFGWTQPNVADLFPGTTIPDDATLLVRVASGSVDVFDSSIDNASGDPVVTPIMPLPLDIPPSATIGSQGGSIRSTDGRFTLKVPAGVLSTPTAFSVVPIPNTAPDGVGTAYEVTPNPMGFSGASVVLTYLPGDLEGSGASALAVGALDGGSWRSVKRGAVDTVRRTVAVPLAFPVAGSTARPSAKRQPLGEGALAMAMFKTFSLTPQREALLTDQSQIFQVRGPGYFVATFPNPTWTANGQPSGQAPFGTLTPNRSLATYRAPLKEPSGQDNPVIISVEFDFADEDGVIFYTLNSRVRILARQWTFVASATLGWSCGRFEDCFEALSYHNFHNLDFQFDESLNITTFHSDAPVATQDDLVKCFNFPPESGIKCPGAFNRAPMIAMITDGLTGRYDKEKDGFALTVDTLNAYYGGGFYQNCIEVSAPIGEYPSGGMASLNLQGFVLGPHTDLLVPYSTVDTDPEHQIYVFKDILTVLGGVNHY